MKRILIIDDDENVRKLYGRYLSGQGYTVNCAEDGQEGLRLLETEPPDLVITDILMPNTDGLEVVLTMRKNNPDTPVIAISGGMRAAAIDFLPMVKKFGACKVFYKPVVLADLLVAVQEMLAEERTAL